MKWFFRATAGFVGMVALFTLAVMTLPASASGGNPGIRQEINITDGYLGSLSGNFATSSAIVQFDGTKYTAPSAYFEVVASTSASIATQVFLRNATSSATVATINIPSGTTAYTLLRSTELTALASTTQNLVVVVASTTGATKGVLAARIVVIDAGSPLSNQETQIEIGNQETYTTSATTTFASPKYWYYNAAGWDGSPTFYAEVTYANTVEPVGVSSISTTTYTASQSVTLNAGNTSTKVMLWGAGGAGGPAAANPSGGAGGAGGQFAQSTIAGLAGLTKTLTIGGATTGCTSGTCATGADTTWDSTVVVAKGGVGGGQTTASTTGSTTGCVGSDFCVKGGDGGAGKTTYGAGGGGGPGVNAAGNSSTAAGVAGTASTDGNGGAGGAKNITSKQNGSAGNNYGAGGGGGFRAGTGGTVTGGQGAQGKAIIVETITTTPAATTTITLQEDNGQFGSWADVTGGAIVAQGTATSPTRVRSAAFTPHDGKHYRIVFSNGYNGATFAIYNAKIVVDQGGTGSIIDSSTVSGTNSFVRGGNGGSGESGQQHGQSFTASQNYSIGSITLSLWKVGSPSDNLYIELASGSIDGTTLATSNQPSLTGLGTASPGTEVTFTFSSPQSLTSSIQYFYRIIRTSATYDATNYWAVAEGVDPYAGGQAFLMSNTAWTGTGGDDYFKTTSAPSTPSLLEPQYLLANTKLVSGTGLQNYLQNFNTTEWTTTNNYTLGVSAANSSASVVELDNTSGPTQITGSVVTSPNNYATSTGMCLTSSAALDTKATTNNSDVYGVSVIAQVGLASTASCGGGAAAAGPQTLIFRDATFTGRDSTITVRDH